MLKDNRFEPVIIICPFLTDNETMNRHMKQAYKYFKKNNYNVVKTLDEKSGKWLNVKKQIKPDVVFFSNPWNMTRRDYLIQNYSKKLTCYVPYTFVISYLFEGYFNQPIHNLVWKFFMETGIHKDLSLRYSRNKSINTVVTGYPGMDKLLSIDYKPNDVWKIKDKKIKRIIWSPHHTIPGMGAKLDYSTFLKYYNVMFEIAEKFRNRIQIAFKPHPFLRIKLSKDEVWGKEKTEKYFQRWDDLPNGQLNEGEYIDLFATSDGILNDSSSFVIEYLYTLKPQLFLMNDDDVINRFNEVGKKALSTHYIGKNYNDIERFLEKVVLGEDDSMYYERNQFFENFIKPSGNSTASENIYNYLKLELNKGKF
jgi:hypothetical protein